MINNTLLAALMLIFLFLVIGCGQVDDSPNAEDILSTNGLISIPKTGQIKVYATYDDGFEQEGVLWPYPRFRTYIEGIVEDGLTGLMWTKDAGTPTTNSCNGGSMTWQEAFAYILCLNNNYYLGFSDWRLPNKNELESIIDYSQYEPALPLINPFINLKNDYWSSTTSINVKDKALSINIINGTMISSNKINNSFDVWPVRTLPESMTDDNELNVVSETGQISCFDGSGSNIVCDGSMQDGDLREGIQWPEPRFSVNYNGTITDKLTGLMWPKNGSTPTAGSCTGGYKTWAGALVYIWCLNSIEYLGYSDWRLPNKIELGSLANAEEPSTAVYLSDQGFRYVLPYIYWTSTTYAGSQDSAWVFDMNSDRMDYDYKTNIDYYVLPVRSSK